MIRYIADLHIGHDNIRRLCNRPFSSVEEMDRILVENWNSVVNEDDTVYILGDFSFKAVSDPVKILKSLKGKKRLLVGNHDRQNLKNPVFRSCFEKISDIETIFDGNNRIVLSHFPIAEWDGYFRGVYHIYGHIHNNTTNRVYKFMSEEEKALNAGVDINNFMPVTFDELIENNRIFREKNR